MRQLTFFDKLIGLLPGLASDDKARLEADIKANGVLVPILALPDGRIIDGWNRYQVAKSLGIEARVETLECGEEEAVEKGLTLNLARRQLSSEQKRELIEALRGKGWTQERVAKVVGVTQHRVSQLEDRTNINFDNSSIIRDQRVKIMPKAKGEIIERLNQGESQAAVAADFGISRRNVGKIKQRQEQAERQAELKAEALEEQGTFNLILADPPWRYEHSKTDSRKIENQYPTMSLDAICGLSSKIAEIKAEDCILFLWSTNPKLEEALEVIKAWGFNYRTNMVWVKDKIGMGYYARQRHELLLFATFGSPRTPDPSTRPDSVVESPREEHSKKPDIFYSLIERMYPDHKKIELFSRKPREGWKAWGFEAANSNVKNP